MSENEKDFAVLELQARWDKIRVANIYDTLDRMGYGDQVIDLSVRPLFPHAHMAGKAVTARGSRDPRVKEDENPDKKTTDTFVNVTDLCYPGCVLVLETGGEPWTGKFGEMTSWMLKQRGAKGIVIDGFIRDSWGLEAIPDYCVCAKGTSPIESYPRWRMHDSDCIIAMPGTTRSQVRIAPGDWVVAEADGVIVIPQEISMEALIKAEEMERQEQGMREDLAAGMSFQDAYKKWGRA